jgi:hypothetical protein
MWWRHALAFLVGMATAAVCIVVGLWVYLEVV